MFIKLLRIPSKKIGDNDNSISIQQNLAKMFTDFNYIVETSSFNSGDFSAQFETNYPTIVIGAGDNVLEFYHKFDKSNQHYMIWSAHQIHPNLYQIIQKLDCIVIPVTSIDEEIEREFKKMNENLSIIKSNGVPHSTTRPIIDYNYQELKERGMEEVYSNIHYTAVVLSGDAPNEEGYIKRFTEKAAEKLANYIHDNSNGTIVLATNSPRTGKYDEDFNIVNDHTASAIDKVSAVFINLLPSAKFYNFQFTNNTVFSAYKGLLGAVANNVGSTVYIPGESTSMISEVLDLLDPKSVIIYETVSMNDNHKKYVEKLIEDGRISYLDLENNIRKSSDFPTYTDTTISQEVSYQIFNDFQEFNSGYCFVSISNQ